MALDPIPPFKERPKLPTDYVALGIVIHGGCILVTRRKKNIFLGGYWEFPGGKREPGESYAQCAVRELMEEVGIRVETVKELLPIRFDYPTRRVVLQPYICRLISGEPRPLQCAEVRWVSSGELDSLDMPEANAPLIRQLASLDLTEEAALE